MKRVLAAICGLVLALLVTGPAEARPGAFPKGFLWGASVSGFQHEGHFPDSNWTRYVAKSDGNPYKNAADFRHRYREDLERAARMGVNAFRTSIEWARIEPARGKWDWKEVRYYDDMVATMRRLGMRPMLTLTHFAHPGWVHDRGAWTDDRTVEDWLRFARFVVERYKGQDVLWVTFNEASFYIYDEYRMGALKLSQIPKMSSNLVKAHRRAYDMIHRLDPGAKVTTNTAYSSVLTPLFDRALFTEVTDKIDFIGLDYYLGSSLSNTTAIHTLTKEYWKIQPEPDGLYYTLLDYRKKFPKLPIYIIENGSFTMNGRQVFKDYSRTDYLRDHLYWIHRAIQDGVKVFGYNYWALIDSYEWGVGAYTPRFGLYQVDVLKDPSLKRRTTPLVAAYRKIIRRNGLPSGYVPVRKPGWCLLQDPKNTCLKTTPTPPIP